MLATARVPNLVAASELCINNDYPANGLHKFIEYKKNMLLQIELLGQSNKTAYTFLREKSKIVLINQQLKWCEIL